jgi:Bacterial Ig-like domain/FG-GAP-like repeat/FG-GAP repeat
MKTNLELNQSNQPAFPSAPLIVKEKPTVNASEITNLQTEIRALSSTPSSSSFTEDTSISLPGVRQSSVTWADYNGDGKLDFLLTGYSSSDYISKLYKNTGSGFAEDTSISLPGVGGSSVAWADYNGDSKLDFLLTGWTYSGSISKLYKNTGSGFAEDTSISLPGVQVGSVAWADYNGDGKEDFLLTGGVSKLYKNTGSGFAEDTSISLPAVGWGSVAWGDYNGDGKQDFLLTGVSTSDGGSISKLYKNTGSGFAEDTSISLPGVYQSSVAWGDYNGDGKQDFLLTGNTSSGRGISKLYKNTGSGFTEDTSISLPPVYFGSVAWGDYNGDGKLDFLLTGETSSGRGISKLYKNTGRGFTEDTSISLPGVYGSSVAWGDYNGDGKQDFLLTGYDDSGSQISKLYKNTTTSSDTTPPTASSFTPTDNATGVAVGANLVVNFSEDIKKGSGDIAIKTVSNKVVETIPVTAANVTVSGSQLTINPTADLAPNKKYYVEIANGAVKDNAGNNYAGIIGDSTWNFKTQGTHPIKGTAGADKLTGTVNGEDINGLAEPEDILMGGTRADTFIFQFGKSSVSDRARVTDFAIGSDKIDLLTQAGAAINAPTSFSRGANSTATTLQNVVTQVFTDANGALASNQALGINSAALVVVTTPSIAGTYLVINDGVAGFQALNDLVINLTGYTGALPALGNIPVSSFFI